MNDYYIIKNGELYHFGVKGMKWGVRKRVRDVYSGVRRAQSRIKGIEKSFNRVTSKVRGFKNGKTSKPVVNLSQEEARKQKAKRAVKVGAVVAGTVLAAYGVKKLSETVNNFNYEQGRRAIEQITRAHDLSYQRYWLSQKH